MRAGEPAGGMGLLGMNLVNSSPEEWAAGSKKHVSSVVERRDTQSAAMTQSSRKTRTTTRTRTLPSARTDPALSSSVGVKSHPQTPLDFSTTCGFVAVPVS